MVRSWMEGKVGNRYFSSGRRSPAGACRDCGGGLERVVTWKNHWLVCLECGNAERRPRERLPLDFLSCLAPAVPGWARGILWSREAIRRDGVNAYHLYAEVARRGPAGTKWERELRVLEDDFAAAGLAIEPPVLDISGGPGFLVAGLAGRGLDATVTEFSEVSCRGMSEALGIRALVFDYNRDRLDRVTNRQYRTVLIRWSIDFCRDLEGFCRDLAAVVEEGGTVYVDFVPPTLGVFLRWQHDEYIFERLRHPQAVRPAFERAGFRFAGIKHFEPYHALSGYSAGFPMPPHYRGTASDRPPGLRLSALNVLTRLPYAISGFLGTQAVHRSLYQKRTGYFFRR